MDERDPGRGSCRGGSVDILTQISAVTTALDRVGLKILDGHVHGCVREAMVGGGDAAEAKTAELLEAVERFARMR